MAGKRTLCFYKAFATRQDQKLLRKSEPCFLFLLRGNFGWKFPFGKKGG